MTQLADRTTSEPRTIASPPKWLVALFIVSVAAGIFFRFTGLGKKVLWHDEVWTAVHVGGHTMRDVADTLFTGKEVAPSQFVAFQHIDPATRLQDVFTSLAADDPHHLPLYYGLVRMWTATFGDSLASLRTVSAIAGVLAIAGMYWLAAELFRSRAAAMLATAMFAVSPYFVLFSQEAREYSFWAMATIISSAALLRALRSNEIRWWPVYALSAALGALTQPLFALVLLSHALYVFAARFPRRDVFRFVAALLFAGILVAPLAIYLAPQLKLARSMNSWMADDDLGRATVLLQFLGGIGRTLFDFVSVMAVSRTFWFTAPALLIIAWAIIELCRTAPKRVSFFPLALAIVTSLTFLVPDLVGGGKRSTIYRLMSPVYLAALLAVAYAIGRLLVSSHVGSRHRRIGIALASVVLAGGVLSCVTIAREKTWWNKSWGDGLLASAGAINHSPTPPIVLSNASFTNIANVLALSRYLDERTRLIVIREDGWPPVPDPSNREIFFFSTSAESTRKLMEMNIPKLRPAAVGGMLWKVPRADPTTQP